LAAKIDAKWIAGGAFSEIGNAAIYISAQVIGSIAGVCYSILVESNGC